MHHVHTGEDITITYKTNGRYDEAALKKLNWFLRDWRRNEPTTMDPKLIDIVYEVWREAGAEQPVNVIGGYRAPATNNMLRRRSKGVARNSQHTVGHAMDFYIPGVPLEKMRIAGLRLQRGGVGYYPSSGSPFVHVDTGSVRHWPRMTHEQLARVFPDGRTVHLPSNGQPLKGYALALADLEKRGNAPSATSLAAARDAGVEGTKRGFFASLFRGKTADDEEDEAPAGAAPEPKRGTAAVATIDVKAEPKAETARAVPLPARRPTPAIQVASVAPDTTQVETTAPSPAIAPVSDAVTASSIVAARGVWDDAGSLRQMDSDSAIKTASINPPAEITSYATLAYATGEKTPPAKSGSGLRFTRKANAGEVTTDLAKSAPRAAAAAAAIQTVAVGDRFDDIWLRAVMLAPDLRYYLSATLIGAPDPKELRALMQKPKSSLALTFTADPMDGMLTHQFSGEAVVFLDTVSFVTRTAALQ